MDEDLFGLLPEDVWLRIASCLQEAADRKAFRAASKAFAALEKQSRAEVILNTTLWGRGTVQVKPPAQGLRAMSSLVPVLADFPGVQILKVVSLGIDQDELDTTARGFGRYVLLPVNPSVSREVHLHVYEPAVALSKMLDVREWELDMAGHGLSGVRVWRTDQVTNVSDNFLEDLGEANLPIQQLEVRHNNQITESGLAHLVALKSLRSLAFVNCVGIKDYSSLQHLVMLETLQIQGRLFNRSGRHQVDFNIEEFLAACNRLRCLHLVSLNLGIGNTSVKEIGQHCPRLVELKISSCQFPHLDSQGLAPLAGLKNLQVLHLSCIENEIDHAFELISRQCTALRSLSITDCPNFSRWALKRLAFNCTQLVELDVSRCKKLALYEALVDLKLCTNLEVLRIDHCIQESQQQLFEELASSLSKLRHFSARGCRGLDQPSLEHILLRCTRLQSLSLAHSRHFQQAGRLLSSLPELKSCDLTGCLLIPESAHATLLALTHCKALTNLSLASTLQIEVATSLEGVVGPHLRQLNLSQGPSWVGDETMKTIGLGCERLEELLIAGCRRVHDQGLQALAGCKRLRSLNVSHCLGLSLDGVVLLLGALKTLESLWIDGGHWKGPNGLEVEHLEAIGTTCPSLKKVACRNATPHQSQISNRSMKLLVISYSELD